MDLAPFSGFQTFRQNSHLPTFPPSHLPTFPPSHLPTFPPSHLPTSPLHWGHDLNRPGIAGGSWRPRKTYVDHNAEPTVIDLIPICSRFDSPAFTGSASVTSSSRGFSRCPV